MKSLVALSEQALLASFEKEEQAARFAAAVRGANERWLLDVVQAYTTVAVFFDLATIPFAAAAAQLRQLDTSQSGEVVAGRLVRIPCCYEFQLDLPRIASHTGLTTDEIIALHSGTPFTVYAIGFCPGFPYLGYLPERLTGVPRLETPRLRVEAGSVGLTGRQTGIYTEVRPGGWNLVGRTPLELVNVHDGYFPLRTGDRVQFERIDEQEYRRLSGSRLSCEGSARV